MREAKEMKPGCKRAALLEGDVRNKAVDYGLVLRVSMFTPHGKTTGRDSLHWQFNDASTGRRMLDWWPATGRSKSDNGTVVFVQDAFEALEEARRVLLEYCRRRPVMICPLCREEYDELPQGGVCRWCEEKAAFSAFARSCGLTRFPDPSGERYVYDLNGRCEGKKGKKGENVRLIDELWNALVRAKGGGKDLLIQ
jgi:hypothetical protein